MRKIAVLLVALFMLAAMAGPALADHEHKLVLPNGKEVVLKCEPLAAADVHPLHNGLHLSFKSGSAAGAAVSVALTGGSCPTP